MLIFAAAAVAMEVLVGHGYGMHAAGAAVCLTLLGIPPHGEQARAHPAIVIPVSVAVAVLTCLSARRSPRVQRTNPFAATDVTGQHAIVLHADATQGQAVVCGQLWSIRTHDDQRLREGTVVRVIEVGEDGLTVEPVSTTSESDA